MRGAAGAISLLLLTLLGAGPAIGAAYPWVQIGDDDVRLVESPRVEVDLRLELVRRARRSIALITYDERADPEVTLPLGTELRAAANRGVRVRFMVSWNSQVLFDYYNKFGQLLVDPPTRTPIEYVIVGGPSGEDEGFNLLDGIHEKFLIIDDELAMTTGRGIGEQYLHWLDTSFAIRGKLVAHIAHCFEAIWRVSLHHFERYRVLGGARRSRAKRYVSPLAPDEEAKHAVDALLAWWAEPPAMPDASSPRARLLHHDFMRQIRAHAPIPAEIDPDERLAALRDPVIEALTARIATARHVRIATVSAILHPKLLQALVAALRRGADVSILVNTAAPRLDRSRDSIRAGGSVWAMEAPDLDALISAGARVHGFQIRDGSPWLFLHRKLAVIDDVVIIGSHNFNVPSSAFFDEASIELENPRLAGELARIFDDDLARNGERIEAEAVHAEVRRTAGRLLRWLSFPFLGYM